MGHTTIDENGEVLIHKRAQDDNETQLGMGHATEADEVEREKREQEIERERVENLKSDSSGSDS